ncbi:hypothetical protein AB0L70_22075 [Kribbella sp. NPDC051952]|uniref:hypothetical protein n=1 Tax=Kribbella sp. NPDC051952 TaxID=3154851 RepID=UPI00342F8E3E
MKLVLRPRQRRLSDRDRRRWIRRPGVRGPGSWHLLIGTYTSTGTDALGNPVGRIEISIDNRTLATESFTTPTRTGNTTLATPATARLDDDLRIYAGVLSQSKACTEYPELPNCNS